MDVGEERPLPGVAGAVIRRVERLPTSLPGAVRVGPYSVVRPGEVLRVVPGLATFRAVDGHVVELAAEADADAQALDSLLHGALAAALIHQRGEFPLHGASLVSPGGRAVAIVGPQGAGKSTLAFCLHRQGWSLLSDDLTRLTVHGQRILAWPGRPGIKLCPDACERYALDTSALPRVVGDRDKAIAPGEPQALPHPLDLIVRLDRGAPVAVTPVSGAAAMAVLRENVFRASYIEPLGQARAHAQVALKIAAAVRIVAMGGDGSPEQFAARLAAIESTGQSAAVSS